MLLWLMNYDRSLVLKSPINLFLIIFELIQNILQIFFTNYRLLDIGMNFERKLLLRRFLNKSNTFSAYFLEIN